LTSLQSPIFPQRVTFVIYHAEISRYWLMICSICIARYFPPSPVNKLLIM